ncbi:MAG: hypothetical protein M3Y87_02380 [Myxococcota bacterium]|nr:hypothetical protein [Myxococcota bacterium]
MRSRPARRALVALTLCVLVAGVARDGGAPRAHAQFEAAVHIATGFIPDPAVLEGRASGVRSAAELSDQCSGFIGTAANHVLALDTRFGYLRLFATSEVDLVLAVRTADGEWMCSDDRFGTHPSVEGLFQRGRVEVWVGTSATGASSDYALRITETRSIRPGVGTEIIPGESSTLARDLGLEVEATEGLFTPIRLRRGFLPDPRFLEGVAGGTIDAGALGGSCRGYITPRPTHVMTLRSPFDFLQLYLELDAEQDRELTLIVLTPENRFLCDVGTREVPDVSADAWPEGVYRVWIGTRSEDATRRHRLGISEIRRAR